MDAAKLILIIFLFVVAYAYSLGFAPWAKTCEADWCRAANELHESCVIGCTQYTKPLTAGRGADYIIGGDGGTNQQMQNCLVTFWGFTHFMLFAMVGFIAPWLFWEMFAVGCLFEFYESVRFNCHDVLDIGLNTLGFLAGSYVRSAVG